MASTPNFASTVRGTVATVSTGNTARIMTSTTGGTLLLTAGSSGSRIDSIAVKATGTTTAGTIRVYVYTGSGNMALFDEIPIPAVTASAAGQAFSTIKSYTNFQIPSGNSVYVSTHNSETFNIYAFGGDF